MSSSKGKQPVPDGGDSGVPNKDELENSKKDLEGNLDNFDDDSEYEEDKEDTSNYMGFVNSKVTMGKVHW